MRTYPGDMLTCPRSRLKETPDTLTSARSRRPRMPSAEVALGRGPRGGDGDLAVTSCGARDFLCRFPAPRLRAPHRVDEILVGFQCSRFEPYSHRGVARSKNPFDVAARRRRFKLARIDGQDVGIVTIAKLPGRAHGLVVLRWFFWILPDGLR